MAAKDYEFVETIFGDVYLAKRTKDPHVMSEDRRKVTDNEIIGLFETLLRRKCAENDDHTLFIQDENGNKIFRAILKAKCNNSEE